MADAEWERRIDTDAAGAALLADADAGIPKGKKLAARRAKDEPIGDPIRADIISGIRNKITKLVNAARRDPSSDASQLVEALLLHQMTTMEFREAEVRQVLEEQRKRRELEKKYQSEHRKVLVKEKELLLKREQLNAARKAVKEAQTAEKQGRPFDTREVVERISAAIGLTGPPERRVEPRAS